MVMTSPGASPAFERTRLGIVNCPLALIRAIWISDISDFPAGKNGGPGTNGKQFGDPTRSEP
jgi:hypothetical protein